MNIQRRLVNPSNYSVGRFGSAIDLVVLHTMDGYLDGTDSWFNNPASQVSTHYGVGMSGSIYQWVEESNTAWACGVWPVNTRSISIEFADQNNPQGIVRTAEAYAAGAELVADICRRNGIPCDRDHVKGHREVSGTHPECPGNLDIDHIVALAQQILGGAAPQPALATSHIAYTPIDQSVTVLSANLNVRTGPATSFPAGQANTPDGMVHNGNVIQITGWAHGESVNGNDIWLRSLYGHWLFAGGTDFVTATPPAPAHEPIPEPTPEPVPAEPTVVPVMPEPTTNILDPAPNPEATPAEVPPTTEPVPVPAPTSVRTNLVVPANVTARQDAIIYDLDSLTPLEVLTVGSDVLVVAVVKQNNENYLVTEKMDAAGNHWGIPAFYFREAAPVDGLVGVQAQAKAEANAELAKDGVALPELPETAGRGWKVYDWILKKLHKKG